MDYEYDVFLSYRRSGEWPMWVEKKFFPLFQHRLSEELAPTGLLVEGEMARIACDFKTLERPLTWPIALGTQLARSRVMVTLWSRQYFNSAWCKIELAHICAREAEHGFGSNDRPERLVIPAIIDDGEQFPRHFRGATAAQLQDCANVRMAQGSRLEELLDELIRRWVPQVAQAICYAPPYDDRWRNLAVERFVALFNTASPRQSQLPSFARP